MSKKKGGEIIWEKLDMVRENKYSKIRSIYGNELKFSFWINEDLNSSLESSIDLRNRDLEVPRGLM